MPIIQCASTTCVFCNDHRGSRKGIIIKEGDNIHFPYCESYVKQYSFLSKEKGDVTEDDST